ncbi:hypothetical protein GGTG_12993 [Gaeumannomyces tritici R3-111a-1]|uniref:Uncharacterized protein n=1 Tax=Gaeumannomyces tritici (strain R3-111a-1) TaxID=644352 RepID=J3PHL3_GAET3|nr:hypothetical protein GGTG_12993 [Gaeumannomyces tritici R3-111a-1]EJT69374.1 hypothetical protein GGTG_12993 [Gaeumannomyces tritici R3-111a-1]
MAGAARVDGRAAARPRAARRRHGRTTCAISAVMETTDKHQAGHEPRERLARDPQLVCGGGEPSGDAVAAVKSPHRRPRVIAVRTGPRPAP